MKRWQLAVILMGLVIGLAPARMLGQAGNTTLYLVATAHLDSQWNWTVQDTIRDHVPKTFHTNFEYFEKYPDYKFSWEGAIHYMWFKEYHPDEWATVQQYVAADRWRLAGSWINAVDTNMPSPESLFRQALYAQRFFRQEFKQGAERHLSAGLLRLRLRAAVDRRALRPDRVLDAEADVGPADSVSDRPLEGRGRQRDRRRAESGQLRHADPRATSRSTSTNGGRDGSHAVARRSDRRRRRQARASGTSARATPAAGRARASVQFLREGARRRRTPRLDDQEHVARSAREGSDARRSAPRCPSTTAS